VNGSRGLGLTKPGTRHHLPPKWGTLLRRPRHTTRRDNGGTAAVAGLRLEPLILCHQRKKRKKKKRKKPASLATAISNSPSIKSMAWYRLAKGGSQNGMRNSGRGHREERRFLSRKVPPGAFYCQRFPA
jgi:hypothetical protein